MSDSDDNEVVGPAMLAATNMLKAPPPVIGSLNKEIPLPRTIRLTTLAAAGIGTIFGFIAGLFVFGTGVRALTYGPALGGALGWAVVNVSPLREESLAKWLGLQANSARHRRLIEDGRPVRLYVGIAPLRRTAARTVRMLPGGVPIEAFHWDPRGFPIQKIPGADRLTATTARQRLHASTRLSDQRRWRRGRKRRQ